MRFFDAGQLDVEAAELEGEALVVDAQAVQQRGVQVVEVDGVLGDVVAEVVGAAIFDAGLGAAAGNPHTSGSLTAHGRLRYKGENIFSGSITASVRSKGFRFRFPRGLGNIDLDLF